MEGMMYCSHCGYLLRECDLDCPRCGQHPLSFTPRRHPNTVALSIVTMMFPIIGLVCALIYITRDTAQERGMGWLLFWLTLLSCLLYGIGYISITDYYNYRAW
jgi:hypothetical protein